MIDFSTNKYIQNIQIKHLHDIYIYEKQQIKLFSLSSLLNWIKKILVKCWAKLVSFISFVLPIYHKAATGFLFLFFLSNQGYTNKQLSSLADSHITHWFELLYKIPFILYCEHPLDFAKEICSSYFMSLSNSMSILIKKIASQFSSIQIILYIKPGESTEWGFILFLSKLELTSLPSAGPKFPQKYLLLPIS